MRSRTICPLLLAAASSLGIMAAAPIAMAATQTAPLNASVTVQGTCSVNTASLAFPNYTSSASNATTTTASITVNCSNGTPYAVSLNAGQHSGNVPSGVTATRAMANGTHYLGYDIFSDNGYGTVWNTTNTVSGVGNGANQTLTAYGQIPAGQTTYTGTYTDQVTITVTY